MCHGSAALPSQGTALRSPLRCNESLWGEYRVNLNGFSPLTRPYHPVISSSAHSARGLRSERAALSVLSAGTAAARTQLHPALVCCRPWARCMHPVCSMHFACCMHPVCSVHFACCMHPVCSMHFARCMHPVCSVRFARCMHPVHSICFACCMHPLCSMHFACCMHLVYSVCFACCMHPVCSMHFACCMHPVCSMHFACCMHPVCSVRFARCMHPVCSMHSCTLQYLGIQLEALFFGGGCSESGQRGVMNGCLMHSPPFPCSPPQQCRCTMEGSVG